jgi:hypothetical protein
MLNTILGICCFFLAVAVAVAGAGGAHAQSPDKFERVVPARPAAPAAPDTSKGSVFGSWCGSINNEDIRMVVAARRITMTFKNKQSRVDSVNIYPDGPCTLREDHLGVREYSRCNRYLAGVTPAGAAFSYSVAFSVRPKDGANAPAKYEIDVAYRFVSTHKNHGVMTISATKLLADGQDQTAQRAPETVVFQRCDAN